MWGEVGLVPGRKRRELGKHAGEPRNNHCFKGGRIFLGISVVKLVMGTRQGSKVGNGSASEQSGFQIIPTALPPALTPWIRRCDLLWHKEH